MKFRDLGKMCTNTEGSSMKFRDLDKMCIV